MAQVMIRINGYAYTIGCKDGEEAHLQAMADRLEDRVSQAKALGSQSGESRLLVMAALMMADELHDLQVELHDAKAGRATPSDKVAQQRLERLAARAEAVADAAEGQ